MILLTGATAVELLLPLRFGAELAVAVGYTGFMIVMIFFPGRFDRGHNPFGAVARRAARPLLLTHLLALLVLLPGSAIALYLRAHYRLPWLFGACLVCGLGLSFWQYLRSSTYLDKSEAEERTRA